MQAPPLAAALATHWVLSGEFASVVAAKRREAAARQAIAAKVLPKTRLAASAGAAYHVWLGTGTLPADTFALRARARGVLVTPSSAFYLGSGPAPSAVPVSLSAAPDRSHLLAGLTRLWEVALGFDGRVAASL